MAVINSNNHIRLLYLLDTNYLKNSMSIFVCLFVFVNRAYIIYIVYLFINLFLFLKKNNNNNNKKNTINAIYYSCRWIKRKNGQI